MVISPEERERAVVVLAWLATRAHGIDCRYDICSYAWPVMEGFDVFNLTPCLVGPILCRKPDADGLVWLVPSIGFRLGKVDLEGRVTSLDYADALASISSMCVDPSDGALILIDNLTKLLHRVYDWESPTTGSSPATDGPGHRIRSASGAARVGALFSACCCGDGFVYALALTEDAEGVVRISVRDDVGISSVVDRTGSEYQCLVAATHDGVTKLFWIQTQLKRHPESELILWTPSVGRRTITTFDFAVGWLDVDSSRRLAWLCGFSRGAAGMRLWRVDLKTETLTGLFTLPETFRSCRIFAQANGRFWVLETASSRLRVLSPVFE